MARPVQGNVASGATDSGNPVKAGAVGTSTQPAAVTSGQRVDFSANLLGALSIGAPVYAGTAGADGQLIQGFSGRDQSTNATNPRPTAVGNYTFNGTSWDRGSKATAASRIVSAAASTNATVAKASAGTLHAISGYNAAAAVRYLKIYNKATAPTVGTDTPILTIAIAATSQIPQIILPQGLYFSAGISYAMTTGSADSDTAALTAADVVGLNIVYS